MGSRFVFGIRRFIYGIPATFSTLDIDIKIDRTALFMLVFINFDCCNFFDHGRNPPSE